MEDPLHLVIRTSTVYAFRHLQKKHKKWLDFECVVQHFIDFVVTQIAPDE